MTVTKNVRWWNRCHHCCMRPKTKCTMTSDPEGKQHVGMHLNWDCDKREVTCSMGNCIQEALSEMEASAPKQHFKGPSKAPVIDCGAKIQHAADDTSPPLSLNKSSAFNEQWENFHSWPEQQIAPHFIMPSTTLQAKSMGEPNQPGKQHSTSSSALHATQIHQSGTELAK